MKRHRPESSCVLRDSIRPLRPEARLRASPVVSQSEIFSLRASRVSAHPPRPLRLLRNLSNEPRETPGLCVTSAFSASLRFIYVSSDQQNLDWRTKHFPQRPKGAKVTSRLFSFSLLLCSFAPLRKDILTKTRTCELATQRTRRFRRELSVRDRIRRLNQTVGSEHLNLGIRQPLIL